MKKLFNYYGKVFGIYGLLTPLVITALLYVVLIVMERTDAFSAIIEKSMGWFVTIAIIGGLLLIGGIIFVVIKALSKEINFIDLCILIMTCLAILMFVLFIFQPGNGSWLSVIKWTVTGGILVASVVLGVLRSLRVK